MIQRQKKILYDIKIKKMSISTIAERQDVTERTIRNDIKSINKLLEDYKASIVKDKEGLYKLEIIDKDLFKKFEQEEMENFTFDYSEPENRIKYIALKFLFSDNYIKLEELMEQMYISRSTIQNDMKETREILNKFNLDFITKPNYGMKIVGSENEIRNAISAILYDINKNSFNKTYMDSSNLFDKYNLDIIYKIVVNNINESEIKLSDIALKNLVVHIAIAIKRISMNQYFDNNIEIDIEKNNEFKIAEKIVDDLEEKFKIDFPMDEVYYITMHLMGTKLIIKKNNETKISDYDKKIIDLSKEIISEVNNKISFDILNDNELLSSIILHLKPAIYRYKNKMLIRNPLLASIKHNYPQAYEASFTASKVIENRLGIIFNEDELGYIAIHFGAAIERAKLNIKPINTLLVCTTGIGSSRLLKYKLESIFSNQLNIVDTTEFYNINKYKDKNIDLIISTVPISSEINIPTIFIQDILGESNFEDIKNFIEKKYNNKKSKYLSIDDIYLNLDFENKEDTIKYLTNRIVEKGKAPEKLYDSIMKRENIVSTAFGNLVAVPHPYELLTDTTFFTLGVLKKPIKWNDKEVQLVIILTLQKNAKEKFEDMYKLLLDLIDNRENVEKIIKAKSPNEIMNLINK